MSSNAKIKVIKKGTQLNSEANSSEAERKTPKQAAREMVSTVSNWVNEFQQRRRDETKQAIETLFPAATQTNGV